MSQSHEAWFVETEKLVSIYWRRQLQIERVEARVRALDAEVRELELELGNAKQLPSITAKYGVTPGDRRGDTGYQDYLARCEDHIDKVSRLLINRRRVRTKLKVRLMALERKQAPMQVLLTRLQEYEQKLLELKFVYRANNCAIGRTIGYSETSIRRLYETVICKLAEWLGKRSAEDGEFSTS